MKHNCFVEILKRNNLDPLKAVNGKRHRCCGVTQPPGGHAYPNVWKAPWVIITRIDGHRAKSSCAVLQLLWRPSYNYIQMFSPWISSQRKRESRIRSHFFWRVGSRNYQGCLAKLKQGDGRRVMLNELKKWTVRTWYSNRFGIDGLVISHWVNGNERISISLISHCLFKRPGERTEGGSERAFIWGPSIE